jgi:uncharacterized membrane protein
MIVLIIGLVIFFGIHLVPVTGVKSSLIERMGEKKYQSIFSIISLVGFIIIIYGFSLIDTCNSMMADCETDNFYMWDSFEYSKEISFLLMPISIIFIVASQMKSNIKKVVHHPMLIGVLIWSFVHLLSTGDLRSIILFASFGAFSIIDIIFTRKTAEQGISFSILNDVVVIVVGLVLYSIILYFHEYVSGLQIVEGGNLLFFLP